MAKPIYNTIEEAAAAAGIEVNDQTRPFLQALVKKATSDKATVSSKKKELLEKAEAFGLTGLIAEAENVTSIQIKVLEFLIGADRRDEMAKFAAANGLFVTDENKIHRVKSGIKPIEERNAGIKEGSVGYFTIQMLKDPEFADLSASALAQQMSVVHGKTTTASCVQWYINYCNKKKVAAENVGNADLVEEFTIIPRPRAAKAAKAATVAGAPKLGAELTLEKAMAPRGFAKKKVENSDLGSEMNVD